MPVTASLSAPEVDSAYDNQSELSTL